MSEETKPEAAAGAAGAAADTSLKSAFNLKPLAPFERKVSGWVAVGAAAMTVALWAPFMDEGGTAWLPIGVVLALALLWASQKAGRMATSIAAFLLSFAVWPYPFVGLPFLALGLWLWFRGRPSQEEMAARRTARAEALAAKRAAKRGEPAPTKKTPPQSKRYTPPARKR